MIVLPVNNCDALDFYLKAFLRMEKNVPDNQRKTRVEDVILQVRCIKPQIKKSLKRRWQSYC